MDYGGFNKVKNRDFSFNLATLFDSILNHINKSKEIIEQEKINQKKSYIGSNASDNHNNIFNNIIFYDPNINFISNINQIIDDFEKNILGVLSNVPPLTHLT